MGAHVLACKGKGRLSKAVHGNVDETFHALSRAVSSHHHSPERVDAGLNQHVGETEKHSLQACGQSYSYNSDEDSLVQAKLFKVKAESIFLMKKDINYTRGSKKLAQNRGKGDSSHVHLKGNHKNQVKNHVQKACNQKNVKGPLGVSLGPQKSRPEIIEDAGSDAAKENLKVKGRKGKHVPGRGHENQHLAGKADSHESQQDAANQSQENGGMDGSVQSALFARPDIVGGKDVTAYAKT